MSRRRTSPDLDRLRDEGYEVAVQHGHLVITHIPYVTENRTVAHGSLISTLAMNGDQVLPPDTHVVHFAGQTPCNADGQPLNAIIHSTGHVDLAAGLAVDFMFSSKPTAGYPDYHAKMTTYVNMLLTPALAIDPHATARTYMVPADPDEPSVFAYPDSASPRAGIMAVTDKLKLGKVAIVGLGGTGSYVLDFVAKTPVEQIHIFDGDDFSQHNAFRAPGAAAFDDIKRLLLKVDYLGERYARMHTGIVPHAYHIDGSNVGELRDMDFVFLTMDGGEVKRDIITALEEFEIPFVDTGLGIYNQDGALGGHVRVTTSTPKQRNHIHEHRRIGFTDRGNDDYSGNIQIAELNALNAALAVLKWKKLVGFYHDLENEHHSLYTIDGNCIDNQDQA